MQGASTDIIGQIGSQNLAHPVFMSKYYVTRSLGQGNTSKVYLGEAVNSTIRPSQVAIKILRTEFLAKS